MKKNSKYQKNVVLNTRGKVVMSFIICVAVFVLVALFMYMESKDGQLMIHNNTDLDLKYVKAKFVSTEDDMTDAINSKSIKANTIFKKSMDPVNLIQANANYEIRFKFDGYDELLVDAGTFNDTFEGNIKINFTKTEDPNLVKITIKASNGFIPSQLIQCDEEYTINLKEGKVIE